MFAKRLPDKDEAAKGVPLAANNAVRMLGDADTLAAAGRYDSARSLVVIAFEESVKTRALGAIVAAAAQGLPPGFDEGDLRQIVYGGHKVRHLVGLIQHLMATQPDAFTKLWFGVPMTSEEKSMLMKLARNLGSANTAKQLGLYVDFDPDSGAWRAPGNTTKAEFEEIRTLVKDFVNETKRQVDASGL